MSDIIKLTGTVLSAMPVGEYDKRLVILTKERGKISAFAKGARRQGNPLMAGSRPFVTGEFTCYEGRSSYTVRSVDVMQYFETLSEDMEGVCYGCYFTELADYYTRENADEREMLKLLYQSLRALCIEKLPNLLVRYVYEYKAMVLSGEYTTKPPVPVQPSTEYTLQFIASSSVEKLYTFLVSEEVLKELGTCIAIFRSRFIDRKFHSLEVLESMIGTLR